MVGRGFRVVNDIWYIDFNNNKNDMCIYMNRGSRGPSAK